VSSRNLTGSVQIFPRLSQIIQSKARVRENGQRDAVIGKLEERIGVLESRLNEIKKQPNTDVIV
jgi:hypothetical protein